MSFVRRGSRWYKPVVLVIYGMTWLNAAAIVIWDPPVWTALRWRIWALCTAGLVTGALLYFVALRRVSWPFARASRLPFARLLPVAVIVMVQGVAEEVVFRGSMLRYMIPSLGKWFALLASTGAFAAAHYPVQGRVGARVHLANGAGFGLLSVITNGLLAPAAAHAVYNALIVVERTRRPARKSSGALDVRVADT